MTPPNLWISQRGAAASLCSPTRGRHAATRAAGRLVAPAPRQALRSCLPQGLIVVLLDRGPECVLPVHETSALENIYCPERTGRFLADT